MEQRQRKEVAQAKQASEAAGRSEGGTGRYLRGASASEAGAGANRQTDKMPGAKGKRRGARAAPAARALSTKDKWDEFQHYGRVVKQLGHGIVMVRYYGRGNSSDPEEKMREIRAKVPIRRRQNKLKVMMDGLVIISIRSFGRDTTGDVIHTYREGEETALRRMKEIPKELLGNGASGDSDGDEDPFAIEFGEEDEFTDVESDGEE